MKFVSFYSLAIFCFCACTKLGKNVTIEGRVMNPITGEGIEGIELELLRTTTGLPGGYKSVKSTNSNSDGSYEISKGGLAGYWLACRVPAEYYQIGWVQNGSNVTASTGNLTVKKGKKMHADYYAVPYGCALWHVKNVNCESAIDTMWYKIKYEYDSDFLNIWSFPYIGCSDALSSYCDKMKMGKHILLLKISRPSGLVYKYDTLFVNENGVTNYNIFY